MRGWGGYGDTRVPGAEGKATLRFLVVDDDPTIRRFIGEILSRAGDDVEEVADGESGLRAYRGTAADVVFVDYGMPEMDGLEFTRTLLLEYPEARIVLMAGRRTHGEPDPLALARKLGARETLRKPFDAADAFRVIDEIVD